MNDPYLILGVTAGTSKTAIKLAYRRLAQKYHPDRNDEVGAEEKFKLIKGAYVFLTTGKSDGTFGEPTAPPPKPKPRPKPKPKEPPAEVWQTGYGAKNVERVQLLVPFGDTFAGVMMRIGSSPFKIFVRPGIKHGHVERRLCQSLDGYNQCYFDLEYRFFDPAGFYKLQVIDGAERLCCHLEMTSGQLLCGFEHSLKNLNPTARDVQVTVSPGQRFIVVPNAGLLLDDVGHRGPLYVIPIVKTIPLEQEIFPVLKAIDRKVQDALKAYTHFKYKF